MKESKKKKTLIMKIIPIYHFSNECCEEHIASYFDLIRNRF